MVIIRSIIAFIASFGAVEGSLYGIDSCLTQPGIGDLMHESMKSAATSDEFIALLTAVLTAVINLIIYLISRKKDKIK